MASGLDPVLVCGRCADDSVAVRAAAGADRARQRGTAQPVGPLALAAGLVVSFTAVGFAIAAFGSIAGLDGDAIRVAGAILLIGIGVVLLVPAAQTVVERAAAPLARWASARQQGLERFGLAGQAAIGVLLGLVWSPCVGPTLGAATVLAAQGEDLGAVAVVMLAFGLGIATELLVIAFAARNVLKRWRSSMLRAGGTGKRVLGGLLAMVGVLILTGGDRVFEGIVVSASPQRLTDATTAI